ncbi:hypothetical protein PENSPDRAFT_630635 [Peniophora sp. CONT]|nr:hypothetical protein PENSPDRAFT_630635 [Peniophora sp. CONT]
MSFTNTNPPTKLPFTMNEKAPAPVPEPQTPVEEGTRPQSRFRSLWRTLVAVLLLWVGWDALSGLGFEMYRAFRYFHPARFEYHGSVGPDMKALLSGPNMIDCHAGWATRFAESSNGTHVARAAYTMPLDASAYLFDALKGSCASGDINFVAASEPRDDVLVDVAAYYTDDQAKWLRLTSVCHVSHAGLGEGIALVPNKRFQHGCACKGNQIQYTVTVHVPVGATVPLLKTNLPSFTHNFEELPADFTFGSVDINAASVVAKELKADSVSVNVKNTAITGFYNITSSLELKTTNAPIDVEVDAYGHHPVWIRLITTNNKIDADISLHEVSRTGRFDVFAHSTNGAVNVDILESPLGGIIKAETKTTNAPARLALGPAFEGEIAAHTTNAQALVDRTPSEDPTGEGRERTVELGHVWETGFRGWTSWGERRNTLRSRARVSSTNKPVVLAF